MIVQILFDGGDQLRHAAKAAAADTFVGDFAEPPLHHVQPGTRSWDEVQMEPWMSPEPRLHARVLVGRVIVHDDMQIEFGRGLDVDLLEETDELLMPMARHAVANHLAVEHAEGRKQGGRAVALVVVRHRPTAAFLHWKTGLGAVQGLDLTFLVHAQDKGFVRGIEIQSDDIVELLDKVFVAADLEGLDEMGLEVVLLPDTLNGHSTDALRPRHGAHAPVGCSRRLRVQRGLDDCPDLAVGDAWDTTGTWSVLFQARQPKGQKPLSPELDRGPGDVQFPGDVLIEAAIGRHLHDLCTLHQAQWDPPAMGPGGQDRLLFGGQDNGGSASHGV